MANRYLEIATEAARKGGELLQYYWDRELQIAEKEYAGDLVTDADRASEKAILDFIAAKCPDHAILSEEAGLHSSLQSDWLWIVDPLDGTTNYTHRFPMVSVSIGLFFQGKPFVGVVFNPINQELFQAAKGQGATLNGKALSVSKVASLSQSLLATGFAYDRNRTADNNYKEFAHLTSLTQGVRRMGSAALDFAYVAAGRLDGYWEKGIKPWDIAAGILLVQEAGGRVTDYRLAEVDLSIGRILATNTLLHEVMSHELLAFQV